jgi:hypothetical protein
MSKRSASTSRRERGPGIPPRDSETPRAVDRRSFLRNSLVVAGGALASVTVGSSLANDGREDAEPERLHP